MDQHQLMSEVGEVLEGALGVVLIQEVRQDDDHTALRIFTDELASDLEEIRGAAGGQIGKEVDGGHEAVSTASAKEGVAETGCKGLQADRIETNEPDIAECGREFTGILELWIAPGLHGTAGIEQNSDRNARLDLEHLEKKLFEAEISTPVDSTQVVPVVEVPVIEKFLARSRRS